MTENLVANQYGIASGLVGFQSDWLRVKVVRYTHHDVYVITADLLDAGTYLCLDPKQVVLETPETDLVHKNGLISF